MLVGRKEVDDKLKTKTHKTHKSTGNQPNTKLTRQREQESFYNEIKTMSNTSQV